MIESISFWVSVGAYAVGFVCLAAGVAFSRERLVNAGFTLAVVGLLAQTLSIAARWSVTGHLPYVEDFENTLAGTWFIAAAYIGLVAWRRDLKIAGLGVLPFVLVTLGYGITQPPGLGVVTPAYKSVWLVIHVMFAWFTYAAYTACASLAVIELIKSGKNPPKQGVLVTRTPDVEALGDLTFRLVGFGFLVNALMIASGAIWAYELWGSYWGWDPVETWSLITWLAYAFYLHARITLGWRGRRLAWVAVVALFGVMMSFWGVQLLPSSYHLFRSLGDTQNLPQRF